jgi:hypothetical protein
LNKKIEVSLPKSTILDKLKEMKYKIPTNKELKTIRNIFTVDPYFFRCKRI